MSHAALFVLLCWGGGHRETEWDGCRLHTQMITAHPIENVLSDLYPISAPVFLTPFKLEMLVVKPTTDLTDRMPY